MSESRDREAGASQPRGTQASTNRMPEDSAFFERIVPFLLIGLGFVTAALILFAAGVLLGFVPFQ